MNTHLSKPQKIDGYAVGRAACGHYLDKNDSATADVQEVNCIDCLVELNKMVNNGEIKETKVITKVLNQLEYYLAQCKWLDGIPIGVPK